MKWKLTIYPAIFLVVTILVLFIVSLGVPGDFPSGSLYTIEKGTGLNNLALDLFNNKIIKSPFLFKSFSVLLGGTKGIIAGDYVLNSRESSFSLANRMVSGDYQLALTKITIPEGLSVKEISVLLSKKFSNIKQEAFEKLALNQEGYLFPDTYLFLPNTGAETVIEKMKEVFKIKILTLDSNIKKFNKPLSDIIKMASIVEEEGRTTETRQVIAGILWRRLSLGMPLQVDASFKYINGKTTFDLTLNDLKIDSPYNSYLYKGLPPTPICNPGLDSIRATITPIKTDYLYFLNDKDGKMHYAKTYAEHLQNKELYLK
ncbi:MAG: endolytic transglycosylase MltG [bacterium]